MSYLCGATKHDMVGHRRIKTITHTPAQKYEHALQHSKICQAKKQQHKKLADDFYYKFDYIKDRTLSFTFYFAQISLVINYSCACDLRICPLSLSCGID